VKVSSLWSMFNKCVSKVVLPGHGPFAAPRRTPAGRPFGRRSGWSPVLCLALSRRVVGLSLMARPDTHDASKVAPSCPPAILFKIRDKIVGDGDGVGGLGDGGGGEGEGGGGISATNRSLLGETPPPFFYRFFSLLNFILC